MSHRARTGDLSCSTRIRELTTSALDAANVDEAGHRLLDVALLGPVSANGRRYSERALDDARRLFEGGKSYLDHAEGDAAHSVHDFIGRLNGLHIADGKLRARELCVVVNEHWPLIHNIATKDPGGAGFSIDADGDVRGPRGKQIVDRLTKAYSVDLVTTPATNKGLFEARLVEPAIGNQRPGPGSKVQSLLFDKRRFSPAQARKWAKDHGFRSSGLESPEGGSNHRVRQLDPGGFKRMRTKQLAPGITAVLGFT